MPPCLVSVIMTAKNEAGTIASAILSILKQTLDNFELIVVNDGSTDDTEQILNAFKDRRIRIVSNRINKGISWSRNLAITMAQGKYIAIFDADDVSAPNRLETQTVFLEMNPDVALCGSWGILKSATRNELFKQPATYQEILSSICKTNPIINSTVMARARIFKNYLYNESLARHEDYDLFLRLAQKEKIVNIEVPLVEFETSDSFSYSVREHYWKTVVRLRAFFLYGYPIKVLFWILPSFIIPFIPYSLKVCLKRRLI